ncbi:MAG: DUF3300 domain-containing protein [Terracidiphilus sp.]
MMETRTIFPVSCVTSSSPLPISTPRLPVSHEFSASHGARAENWIFVAAAALLALVFAPAHVMAQQGYPSSPHGAYPSPYAQPAPPYGYAQPQYQQPQYAQPQQPQYGYGQPQYAQPQYTPQEPYAQQPNTGQPYEASPYQQQDLSQPAAAPVQALSAEDLEQLLAPIALYPDALLAQILAASTYPAQVAVADQWLQSMQAQGYGSPDQIAAGASAQTTWDPSIKALTALPDVLDMMNHNLEWTTNLGNAYYNQPQDVMQTVQVLRQRAEQAGNLQTTPQEGVTNDQGYIELAPANPQVVYVPTYDPWDVYGQPVAPYPGFSLIGALGSFFGGAPIQYGLGFALSAFDQTPFGWLAWGLDWLAHAILFDHSDYYTHSATVADWGLPHGGPRAYYGRGEQGRMHDGAYRSYNTPQNYNQRDGYQRGLDQRSYNQRGYDERGGAYNNGGYQQPARGYNRPALPTQQAFDRPGQPSYSRVAPQQNYGYRPQTYPNRAQTYASPPQTFSNPRYGYGYANRSASNYTRNAYSGQQVYTTRPGFSYANPYSTYHAPQSNASRAFSGRPYDGYGSSMARNEHSGGFHLFGHSEEPKGFSGGRHESLGSERAPKYSYKAPKSHGSFGGGHEKAPKMGHSGGGGGGGRRRR